MENGKEIRLTRSQHRVHGWMTAAGIVGLFSLLVDRMSATPLGWLAALCGAVVGLCFPQMWPDNKAGRWLGRVRWLWSLPVMAVSLRYCAEGVTEYSYPGWNLFVPAALGLLLSWRGSCLDAKALERYGKLLMWMVSAIVLILVAFTVYMVRPERLLPRNWGDMKHALWIFVLSAGAVSFVLPAEGRLPGLVSAGLGASMVAMTTGAEGVALARLVKHPFLTICNAGAYEMRLGVLASALWLLGETAVLTRMLTDSPGGKWGKAISAVIVFLLVCFMPVTEGWKLILLLVGAAMGYIGMIMGKCTSE